MTGEKNDLMLDLRHLCYQTEIVPRNEPYLALCKISPRYGLHPETSPSVEGPRHDIQQVHAQLQQAQV